MTEKQMKYFWFNQISPVTVDLMESWGTTNWHISQSAFSHFTKPGVPSVGVIPTCLINQGYKCEKFYDDLRFLPNTSSRSFSSSSSLASESLRVSSSSSCTFPSSPAICDYNRKNIFKLRKLNFSSSPVLLASSSSFFFNTSSFSTSFCLAEVRAALK